MHSFELCGITATPPSPLLLSVGAHESGSHRASSAGRSGSVQRPASIHGSCTAGALDMTRLYMFFFLSCFNFFFCHHRKEKNSVVEHAEHQFYYVMPSFFI